MAKITRINPDGISKPFSNYSHVVTAEGAQSLPLKTIAIAKKFYEEVLVQTN